jgi:CheY-like chemotaxis protein
MEIMPSNPRILFAADDDVDDVNLIKLLLRKAGVSNPIEIYSSGDDIIAALSALLKKSLNVVLPLLCFLDVKMPGLTGFDVLKWIRQQSRLDGMSVVMLSSSEHPEDVKRAANEGAQCYLAKYPQPAVLRSVVEEAERHSHRAVRTDWFGLPANLLLRWGLAS